MSVDEPTSKVVIAVITFVGSLIWPASLLWFVYYFREAIEELLKNIKSFKLGSAEMIVADRLERLQSELQRTNLVVGVLAQESNRPEIAEAEKNLLRPPGELVAAWARKHGADNPWDMGPRNWERCLFDLGYGGKKNELLMKNGKLEYQ